MNILVAIAVVISAGFASYFALNSSESKQEAVQPTGTVASSNIRISAIPTTTPAPTATPTNTLAPTQSTQADTNYIYPGSTIHSQSDTIVELSSTDDPETITQWYKTKITQEGLQTNSFVSTNTNDSILNTLVASSSSTSIQVVIRKDPDSSTSFIKVEQ